MAIKITLNGELLRSVSRYSLVDSVVYDLEAQGIDIVEADESDVESETEGTVRLFSSDHDADAELEAFIAKLST